MTQESLVYNSDKVLGFDQSINVVLSDGKLLCTVLKNLDGFTLEIGVGTELGSLDGSFDCSNDVNIEGLFIGDSVGSADGKVLGSD